MRKLATLLLVLALAVVAAGCGSDDDEDTAGETTTAATTAAGADDCSKDSLELVEAGRLTIGTDNPAFPPWFDGGDARGLRLGDQRPGHRRRLRERGGVRGRRAARFRRDRGRVGGRRPSTTPSGRATRASTSTSTRSRSPTSATARSISAIPTTTSIRRSSAYKGTPITEASTLADLAQYQLGAQVGTTSLTHIQDNIEPDREPRVYDTSNDVVAALNGGQIDGIVVDLPTAFFLVGSGEVKNGTVVGQFPSTGDQEHFGILFEDGNPLRDCVNEALSSLRDDGTLEQIQQQWLAENTSAPVIE